MLDAQLLLASAMSLKAEIQKGNQPGVFVGQKETDLGRIKGQRKWLQGQKKSLPRKLRQHFINFYTLFLVLITECLVNFQMIRMIGLL